MERCGNNYTDMWIKKERKTKTNTRIEAYAVHLFY
jgi:hypothetical protein